MTHTEKRIELAGHFLAAYTTFLLQNGELPDEIVEIMGVKVGKNEQEIGKSSL